MKTFLTSVVTGLSLIAGARPAAAQTPAPRVQPSRFESAQAARQVRRLSVDEAVQLALEQNLNLQIERINPQLQDLSIALARTAWTPTVTAEINDGRSTEPTRSVFAGAVEQLRRDQAAATVGWSQRLPWAGTYTVAWDNSRVRSNSLFDNPNPALSSTLAVSYVQPLLRDLKIDDARRELRVTEARRDISDVELKQTVLNTVRTVKTAYWELVYAASFLSVRRQARDLAAASLRNSRARLEAGLMAPLDVVEAESEVPRRDEAVIVAEAALALAEDRLRVLILDSAAPDFWQVRLEPTDAVNAQAIAVDVETAVTRALDQRTDLRSARKDVDVADIDLRFFQNQTLPDVRARVDHGLAGQGGTMLQFGPGFPPASVGGQAVGFGPTLRNLADNESWRVSLSVAYPIGGSAAGANLARAKLRRVQAQMRVRSLELQVATEVRAAGRRVNTDARRIDATRAARQLAEQRLEAEQKKFAAGLSTTFLVLQAQRDLGQARDAELRATLDYNTSVVRFELIQGAPVSGA